MATVIALIPIDLTRSRLGLPAMLDRELAGRTVLARTIERVARVDLIDKIVLVYPAGQTPQSLLSDESFDKPIESLAFKGAGTDRVHPARVAARKWALRAWRGGPGAHTCYDELLPAAPLAAAMNEHGADAALLVGGDWPLVDPQLCQQVLERHLAHPDAMQMVFTQAPPGLAGIAVGRQLIDNLAESHAGFSQLFGYTPTKPQPDPIGLDVCVQIPAKVRSCARRFIYDTPRSVALIDRVALELGDRSASADAAGVAAVVASLETESSLPEHVTIELTPRRAVNGPIMPHHYVQFERPDMDVDLARRLVEQVGEAGDVALTLGGLGDALLHPDWADVVTAAHEAGVFSLAVETDLLVDPSQIERLLELPIDIVSVRLNADTAALYEQTMGADRFGEVIEHLQMFLRLRAARGFVPWLLPRMVKTNQTLADMETFFDRWVHFAGHAVIEPATTGCSCDGPIMPQQSPVQMAPPKRFACRQLEQRMTVHSDGSVALCDQDWLGGAPAGDATITPLTDIWQTMQSKRQAHRQQQWTQQQLCAGCHEWHRP